MDLQKLRKYYTLHKIANDYRPPAVTLKTVSLLDISGELLGKPLITLDRRFEQTVLGYGEAVGDIQKGASIQLMLIDYDAL